MGWTVTKQVATKGPDAGGNYVDGFDVTYETDTGLTNTVFFPNPDYNVENVKNTLAALNATHDSIAGLSG